MSGLSAPPARTLADLLRELGDVPAERVVLDPLPGQATEEDVIRLTARKDALYELVDGTIVLKPAGFAEALVAAEVACRIGNFIAGKKLGFVAGSGLLLRLRPGIVRRPAGCFIPNARLPPRDRWGEEVQAIAPALVVELDRGMAQAEKDRRVREFLSAGVLLYWHVDPAERTVQVFTAPDRCVVLAEEYTLDGGSVLAGLSIPVRDVFSQIRAFEKWREQETRASGEQVEEPSLRKVNSARKRRGV